MSNECMTLDEFLEQYILNEKVDANDGSSDLFDYENWDTYLKNQKKQELFEGLIKRLNLLFEIDLPEKQLVEKRFNPLKNENIDCENSDDDLITAFDNITPVEQKFFAYLLKNLSRKNKGTDTLHLLGNYDWRPVQKETRDMLQVYLKKLADSNSNLFDTLISSEDLLHSAYLKLENPEEYFFKRSILAVLDAPENINRYSEKIKKPYKKEIESYLKERDKALQSIDRKLKKIIIVHSKLMRKLRNDKNESILQFKRLKKQYFATKDCEKKKQLAKQAEKLAMLWELPEDSETNEKLDSILKLFGDEE